MIRIRRVSADAGGLAADTRALPSEVAARAAAPAEIIRDFADPYLELVRLLREASEIEHALLVQYLYAAYSLKPQYVGLRGPGTFGVATNLLGVAIQEMQHLAAVNRMLVDLDAAPNLVRQDFPYEPDIYPFPLNLEPLTRESVAKYVYTEAPAAALDRDDPANADPATQQHQLTPPAPGTGRPRSCPVYSACCSSARDRRRRARPGRDRPGRRRHRLPRLRRRAAPLGPRPSTPRPRPDHNPAAAPTLGRAARAAGPPTCCYRARCCPAAQTPPP